MRDRRREILERLAVILKPLATTFARNRGRLPTDKRPAILLLDGDEISTLEGKGPGISGNVMALSPQIVAIPDNMQPQNIGVGDMIADFRLAIIEAVQGDDILASLTGSNGRVDYRGMETDLKEGQDISGAANIVFTFVYPFIPGET